MIICEICNKEVGDRQALWGIQVAKPRGKPEFHLYCSEEHAKVGEKQLAQTMKMVGEIVDA